MIIIIIIIIMLLLLIIILLLIIKKYTQPHMSRRSALASGGFLACKGVRHSVVTSHGSGQFSLTAGNFH
jgi:hypothetical protein